MNIGKKINIDDEQLRSLLSGFAHGIKRIRVKKLPKQSRKAVKLIKSIIIEETDYIDKKYDKEYKYYVLGQLVSKAVQVVIVYVVGGEIAINL